MKDYYKGKTLSAIDVIEDYDLNFHMGNIIKYALRAGKKTADRTGDLEKIIWYAERELNIERGLAETRKELTDYDDTLLKY